VATVATVAERAVTERTVAVVLHGERSDSLTLGLHLVNLLTGAGHAVRMLRHDAERVGRPELGVADDILGKDCDLAVSIGGDGTMLWTFSLVVAEGVPVLGVNHGQLGYLTEVEPDDVDDVVLAAVEGRYPIEERMMVQASVERADGSRLGPWEGLNEAVVEKAQGHTARLTLDLDGAPFTSLAADGLIVSTPTGSTAYALSAGGAVVEPQFRCLQLTMVAPHMLFDRSLVLDPSTVVRIGIGPRPVVLTMDGRTVAELAEGDAVVVSQSPLSARLVTLGQRRFHDVLKSKFGLQDR
jgi:NAD+ kinase